MSKLIHQHSTLNRIPKTLTTRRVRTTRGVQQIKVSEPAFQSVKQHNHLPTYFTQTFRSVPSNLFTNNGAKYSAELEAGSFTKLRSATLKITVSISGVEGARLAGVPHWFNRIEVRSGSKHLGIVYGDNLMFNLGNLTGHQLDNALKNANMTKDWKPREEIPLNTSRTFYLPLINTFLNNSEIYMKSLESDLTIDFYPENDIRIEGNGVVSCDDLQLICETETLSPDDEKVHDQFHKSVITSSRYLDVIPVNFYNEPLTAGQQRKFELDSVHGKVAGMLVLVKPTGVSNTDNGLFKYVSLGEKGTIDILDSGSRSILGNGTPVPLEYLRNEVWPSHYANDFVQQKNLYWLPFTTNSAGSFAGKVDGHYQMSGDRNYLAITPSTTGVQEEQWTALSEVATSGFFTVSFRGEKTAPLPYNATLVQIQDAVNALSSLKYANPTPLSVVVVGTPDSTTSVQFQFQQQVDLEGDLIHIDSTLSGVDPVSANTTRLTQGQSGFTSGNYDVVIYAMAQSKVFQDTQGRLSVEQE